MNKIELDLIEKLTPSLAEPGYDIVKIKLKSLPPKKGQKSAQTMEVMIENLNNSPIVIKDCIKVTKLIDSMLNEQQLGKGLDNCAVEVGSPGINRPLERPKDFIKYQGSKIRVKLKKPINNKHHLKGIILAADEAKIICEVANELEGKEALQKLEILLTDIAAAELAVDIKI